MFGAGRMLISVRKLTITSWEMHNSRKLKDKEDK